MTKLCNMPRSGVPALRRSIWPFADETGRIRTVIVIVSY